MGADATPPQGRPCPGRHIRPIGYTVAIDALTHNGPADPARIDRSVGNQAVPPGLNPATVFAGYVKAYGLASATLLTSERVPEEPALSCYVFGTC